MIVNILILKKNSFKLFFIVATVRVYILQFIGHQVHDFKQFFGWSFSLPARFIFFSQGSQAILKFIFFSQAHTQC